MDRRESNVQGPRSKQQGGSKTSPMFQISVDGQTLDIGLWTLDKLLFTAHCPPLQCFTKMFSLSRLPEPAGVAGAVPGAERMVLIACSAERIPEARILNSSALLALCNASSIEISPD